MQRPRERRTDECTPRARGRRPGCDPGGDRGDPRRLSRTVDELGARLDVPARARERAYRARDTAVETYRESPPVVLGGVLALVGVVVGLVILRRKRANRRRNR